MRKHLKALSAILAALTALAFQTGQAFAQTTQPSHCRPVAQTTSPILKASFRPQETLVSGEDEGVTLSFISHAQFRIVDAQGIHIATDYSGFDGTHGLPTVATMNTVHHGHLTFDPHPDIPHILHGWKEHGEPSRHYLNIDDVIVRNVTTDFTFEPWGGREDENSIFIFEIGGLCIGHLGQLHDLPTDEQFADIGRLDIVMLQVDRAKPLSDDRILEIVRRVGARVVIPMHWFERSSIFSFVDRMEQHFPIDGRNESTIDLSLRSLPDEPTLIVLTPETSFPLFE